MAKNNGKALIPKFLNMDAARELNNLVYKNSGCFLFMTLPSEKLLSPRPTTDGGGNYSYNVLSLYKMYNDYGHFFVWFSIQKSSIPRKCTGTPDLENEIRRLLQDQPRVLEHYVFITKYARHILAHGVFQQESSISPFLDPKTIRLQSVFKEILSDHNWPESDSDWLAINKWLTAEADYMYEWIKAWASIWSCCEDEKSDLQKRFYYGRWEYATNKDSCRYLEEEAIIPSEYGGRLYYIFEENGNEVSSFARAFSYQLVVDAKDYLVAATSKTVRSEYEEGGLYWKSDCPELNLKYLFRNINYYGIKNARDKMYHPSRPSGLCQDVYKLYLEGLVGKMITLPAVSVRGKRSDRFKRK